MECCFCPRRSLDDCKRLRDRILSGKLSSDNAEAAAARSLAEWDKQKADIAAVHRVLQKYVKRKEDLEEDLEQHVKNDKFRWANCDTNR